MNAFRLMLSQKSMKYMERKKCFIFDIESTSLYGKGFAAGAIVCTPKFIEGQIFHGINIIDKFELFSIEGAQKANEWVKQNVLSSLFDMPKCRTDRELRNKFYEFYIKYKDSCEIYSDVNFPVETNFLSEIVNDDIKSREFKMPYPLYDIANFINIDIDRNNIYEKECHAKLRKHNPLDDCIASAYNFFKYFCKNK